MTKPCKRSGCTQPRTENSTLCLNHREQAHRARLLRHRHNGLTGYLSMAERAMVAIGESPTTTPEAKKLADEIYGKCIVLRTYIKERVEPDGTRVFPKPKPIPY